MREKKVRFENGKNSREKNWEAISEGKSRVLNQWWFLRTDRKGHRWYVTFHHTFRSLKIHVNVARSPRKVSPLALRSCSRKIETIENSGAWGKNGGSPKNLGDLTGGDWTGKRREHSGELHLAWWRDRPVLVARKARDNWNENFHQLDTRRGYRKKRSAARRTQPH